MTSMKHIAVAQSAVAIVPDIRYAFWRGIVVACIFFAALAQPANAQPGFPNKPIRFVVAFAPGGITDIVARLLGERLTERLGQSIVIDNKGGAAGALGAKMVATSDPDGYTLLVTTTAVAIGAAASTTAVDPRSQLTPIALAASTPTIISAKAPAQAKTLMEFVRARKDGHLTYSSAGVGTTEHLTAAYIFKKVPGLEATHVPFRSGSETVNAVLGNHVDLSATSPPTSLSFIQDGKLQVLAVASHKRVAQLPDVPTLAEMGLVDVENASWIALFGPPGMSPATVQFLNTEVQTALRAPEFRERLTKIGYDVIEGSQPQFVSYIQSEVGKWGQILKETGVTLN
jgi:tripartite-type tricarboxylate transporter receptor subunit TctC